MKTILLVDDSSSIRNILKNALMTEYTVLEADNGIAALEVLKSGNVDFFLFDVNMPEMDGISLLGKVREMAEYRNTPILMLTTETKEELRQQGRELGASGWVVKPCDPDRLLAAIKKLI